MNPPYQSHSETSKAAAEEIKPHVETLRTKVLNEIRLAGPLSDEGIQIALNMNGSTERPRRKELLYMGLVRDSGKRFPTFSGRMAIAWEAVPESELQARKREQAEAFAEVNKMIDRWNQE